YDDQAATMNLPSTQMNLRDHLCQWWHMSRFYFKSIVLSVSFVIIVVCGIGFIALGQYTSQVMFGVTSLPVTYMLLDTISSNFMLFALIIIIVYTGELIWKDISNRFSIIMDSSPLSNHKIILSKFSAMIMIELLLVGIIIATGVTIQLLHGFYDFSFGIYFKSLFLNFFPTLFLMTFLTFLVHTLSGNKFLGHGLVILIFVGQMFYRKLGITHLMFKYASSPTMDYSGMNGFQKFVSPALTYDFYWTMAGLVFLCLSILFIKRGTEKGFGIRLQLSRINWKYSRIKYVVYSALFLFVVSGCAIYYNANVLNTFRSKKETRKFAATYERTYSRYKNSLLPRITDVNIAVDIYPDQYAVTAKGRYILVNKNSAPLDSIHLRLLPEFKTHKVSFSRTTTLVHASEEYGYYIYKLDKAIAPGDTIICSFDIACHEKGFRHNGRDTEIVPNGTFFRNEILPYFGYDENLVLTEKADRKKEKLKAREFESAELSDTSARRNIYISHNADRITYEAVVSTSDDQIALTCGTLIKEWKKNGRRYFHYKSEEPIWNFVPFVSARYEVVKDKAGETGIEIYYHPGHTYNLDKMLKAAKRTIAYCNENFYPYQHKQIRIVEIPRYSMYAQSFAGIIPFSEGLGFIADIDKDDDIDLPFYITAHEIAHQWWGHQVCAADVKGKLMLVESLANYTALMVMEKEFGRENIGKALKYEQTRYLLSRSLETKKEVPLNLVDDQLYIGYQKGSVTLYALRDYIGEQRLNGELKN
ncbi:MAG TPA: M1 family aminopeptidase, partial [Bacteroidales bacterium]|nr:M1 family aminopeptidase [Bacteroidales bacterium]